MDHHTFFHDQTILITGGTGTFGRALARRLLTENDCKKVIIFSRDEWKQWEMRESDPIFNHPKIRYFLGDVRDLPRLNRAFSEVDYVVHAAALKQVPAAEYNPTEFIKTNVIGSMNIIEAALNAGVKKVIALSTDKACYPVNLYGATKLCADKLFVNGNSYVGKRGFPLFSVVRYGNVLGSRGSILPMWMKAVKDGAQTLAITDDAMTRFWITTEEAVTFVIHSFLRARGGEIFVPKIPSMRIVDLADAIAPGVKRVITGIRPGEKLHEMMINPEDARHTLDIDDHYVIVPEAYADTEHMVRFMEGREGRNVPAGFAYTSDANTQWMTPDELKKTVKTMHSIF